MRTMVCDGLQVYSNLAGWKYLFEQDIRLQKPFIILITSQSDINQIKSNHLQLTAMYYQRLYAKYALYLQKFKSYVGW